MASRKEHKGLRRLGAAFAAVAIGGGALLGLSKAWNNYEGYDQPPANDNFSNTLPVAPTPPLPANEPNSLNVFGMTATEIPMSEMEGDVASVWNDMLERQNAAMRDPTVAQSFNDFLAGFDQYRGLPLDQMARAVNGDELKDIPYNNNLNCTIPNTPLDKCPGQDVMWLAPVETLQDGAGNCVDQAILMYYIMRHLDVPANRLFILSVSATGSTQRVDHAVLLLNTAPDGQDPTYLVMSDNAPVIPADNDAVAKNWSSDPFGFQPWYFVPFYALNEEGAWVTPLMNNNYYVAQSLPSPAAIPVPAKQSFTLKLG